MSWVSVARYASRRQFKSLQVTTAKEGSKQPPPRVSLLFGYLQEIHKSRIALKLQQSTELRKHVKKETSRVFNHLDSPRCVIETMQLLQSLSLVLLVSFVVTVTITVVSRKVIKS